MSKMDRFKYQAFVQEFPFLKEITAKFSSQYCDDIRVARADEDLLYRTPERHTAVGSLVGIDREQTISFVLVDGTVMQNAVRQQCYHRSNYAHEDGWNRPGESILEAIDRHGISSNLEYIVSMNDGYNVVDHHSGPEWRVTIHKTPKTVTYCELIEDARAAALAQVRAEAEF